MQIVLNEKEVIDLILAWAKEKGFDVNKGELGGYSYSRTMTLTKVEPESKDAQE